jgi:hypothetical protein
MILLSLLLASCANQPADAQEGNAQLQEEPVFQVTAQNSDDQVTFQYEDNTAIIDVTSPTGIGSAQFKLESGSMPGRIVARLHLAGLEQFRPSYGQTVIAVSLPSGAELSGHSQTVIQSSGEILIEEGHPLWMNFKVTSEGAFELDFPAEFIRDAGDFFEIQWIDFYR